MIEMALAMAEFFLSGEYCGSNVQYACEIIIQMGDVEILFKESLESHGFEGIVGCVLKN